ncbi:fimbrillin family protein [Prevotella copri]|uniref:fimbrillin family protein n=1 Tax=Segatella copri TaxID=165179 RepID=UPI001F2B59E3|nr:fimbrillin family protein [Segatella copri]MCF2609374.1 fimbrillin family protein [Segatella copri]
MALTSISCSDSEGWMSGIPLSNEKISFTASLQEGWSGGQGSGDKSRAVKPDFPGLAREQKVLTTDEAFSKPLYLHPIETVNKTLKNQGPTTRGTMNFDPVVNNFGVSANYIQKAGSGDLFHNQEAKKEGSNWFVAGNKTWPLDCSVSFYAYAPYNDASLSLQGNDGVVKNKTIHYTANTVDLSKQPDLIVAKSESNAFTSKTANKAVNLSFSHALTAITFSISADMIPGTVKSITVSGVYGQGDYDLSKVSWVPLANSSSTYAITLNASVKAGESKALTDKNSALMMIPQDLGPNAKVSMVFNDGAKDKTVSFSLDGTSWTAGKHITYMLSSSKITTLKMGKLTYPTGWNSVNEGANAKNLIRTAYAPNTSAGLFVVNEEKKVIAANVQLTYDGTSWSLPTGSKLKFSPQYSYFVYYPYQDQASLAGLPAVNTTVSDVSISSSTQFFADAIATWKEHKIATDQSTPDKMNACDLQIGKASLDEDGCSVSFKMEHAMGLAEIVLDKRSFTNSICYLVGYEEYPTWNGTTTSYASCSIKNHTMYGIADHRYVSIVKPGENSFMSATDKDAWIEEVKLSPAANEVKSGTAYNSINPTTPHAYTLAVGDIYYSDGAISHQEDDLISTSGRIPIGIVGYTTMNGDGNYWTEKGVSGKGGHALVMCLKTIGSTGKTSIGTGYAWYSSNSDTGRKLYVNSKEKIVDSKDRIYGSGYTDTNYLITKWGSNAAAAYQAQKYNTLPAPSSKCTGWFLPSAGQYYAVMTTLGAPFSDDWTGIWDGNTTTHPKSGFFTNMYTVTTNINKMLKIVGDSNYTEFFGSVNTWAWTSSEFSSTNAVGIDSGVDDFKDSKGSGSVRFYGLNGDEATQNPVRPFLAF